MTKNLQVSPVVEVLRKARALIEQGWCSDGPYLRQADGTIVGRCAMMAIWESCFSDGVTYAAAQRFRRVVREQHIGDWNDAPGRTKAEVLQAFDKAIALEMGLAH